MMFNVCDLQILIEEIVYPDGREMQSKEDKQNEITSTISPRQKNGLAELKLMRKLLTSYNKLAEQTHKTEISPGNWLDFFKQFIYLKVIGACLNYAKENLPSPQKTRLCAFVDGIIATLNSLNEKITSFVDKQNLISDTNQENTINNDNCLQFWLLIEAKCRQHITKRAKRSKSSAAFLYNENVTKKVQEQETLFIKYIVAIKNILKENSAAQQNNDEIRLVATIFLFLTFKQTTEVVDAAREQANKINRKIPIGRPAIPFLPTPGVNRDTSFEKLYQEFLPIYFSVQETVQTNPEIDYKNIMKRLDEELDKHLVTPTNSLNNYR